MEDFTFLEWAKHILFVICTPIMWLICLIVLILPLWLTALMFKTPIRNRKKYLWFLPTFVYRIIRNIEIKHADEQYCRA